MNNIDIITRLSKYDTIHVSISTTQFNCCFNLNTDYIEVVGGDLIMGDEDQELCIRHVYECNINEIYVDEISIEDGDVKYQLCCI